MADIAQPIRIQHNVKLADAMAQKFKLTSRYPKVSEQLSNFPIGPGLVRFGYNPTIAEEEGLIVMTYRYHDGDTLSTRLALAQLDYAGNVLSNRSLKHEGISMEDPKLFWWRDQLHISWVESTFPTIPLRSVVKYARLFAGQIEAPMLPKLPGNDWESTQKNYVFFDYGQSLYCLYQRYPVQQIFRIEGENVGQPIEVDGLRWAWGEPRGGTVPIPYKGHLLSFFHSGLDNEYGQHRRRYFVGAMLMSNSLEEGLKPVAISKEPILLGSEIDDISVKEWAKCNHRKPQVVFPGGVIQREDHWLLAVGVNDYECLIMKVAEKDLKL